MVPIMLAVDDSEDAHGRISLQRICLKEYRQERL
jgi:hypothetical protein